MPPNKSSGTISVASPCIQCNKSFVDAIALTAHRRSKHPVPCTYASCIKIFRTQEALRQHLDSAVHANKRSNPVKSLSTSSDEMTPQAGPSKAQPRISNTPGTIPKTNVEFLAPIVVGKTPKTWGIDSLTSHFGSSLYINTPPRPAIQLSPSVPRVPRECVLGRERAVEETIPGKRAGVRSKVQAPNPQPAHKKTVVPQCLQHAALIALTASCHSRATLIANNYTLNGDYTKIIEDASELMHIALPTPTDVFCLSKRAAIALNCDIVGQGYNESEISHISASDYLTGEVIIDALVQSIHLVTDWRTNYNKLSKKAIATATAAGTILKGWPEARSELWKSIGPNTILVGHNLHHDLTALRMEHWRVVDSAILASEAVGRSVKTRWSLKALCNQLLGMKMQSDKNGGRDCIEDALAVREVILWWIQHPVEVSEWAAQQQKEWHRGGKQAYNDGRITVANPDDWIWSVLASTDYNPFSG